MLRAVAMGTRATEAHLGTGMREAVAKEGMATGALLNERKIG